MAAPAEVSAAQAAAAGAPADDEAAQVAALLGRPPRGDYEVVVRDAGGSPVVVRNHPLLRDGRPMPTRWWLVGRGLREAVSRLEAAGGVRAAEAAVDPAELAGAHRRYAALRDAALPAGYGGPRPGGGVGGTRRGVKCLHAHLAWHLAGGDDPVGRWVARRLAEEGCELPERASSAVAAVDCGTNSTRLLVAGPDGATLCRLMRITRLGQGVDATGRLAPGAIERTLEVLREYRRAMDGAGVGAVRMTATSAVRDAANREDFVRPASRVVGTAPEVLSGEEEGRLSWAGATAELDPAGGPYVVVDIGGGSTEVVLGPAPTGAHGARGGDEPVGTVSMDVGCVRLTERFLRHDPPEPAELARAAEATRQALGEVRQRLPGVAGAGLLVGLAGTVSTLAALDQGLESYDRDRIHHHTLERRRVEEILASLAAEPARARAGRPGVEEARADVIVGGAVVLATVMAELGLDRCLVSESDILDGMVMGLLRRRPSGAGTAARR